MKRYLKNSIVIVLFLLVFKFGVTAYAADVFCDAEATFKISMNGTIKQAQNIGTSKGVSVVLPELDAMSAQNYIITGIELAVFEQKSGESRWNVYKDKNGKQSKCIILNDINTRNFNIVFGNPSDYRVGAKYKIAYRYYANPVDDPSQNVIVNQNTKEGWRLIGENAGTTATDTGFTFYVNSCPTAELNYVSFTINTNSVIDTGGKRTIIYTPEQSFLRSFPNSVLSDKSINVNVTVDDTDDENINVSYKILSYSGMLLSKGILASDVKSGTYTYKINDKAITDNVIVKVYAYDDFGGNGESVDGIEMCFDTELPTVKSEFNTKGYSIKGKNIYSKFTVNDDKSVLLTGGEVYYTLKKKNSSGVYTSVSDYKLIQLPNSSSGTYIVDINAESDGNYAIELLMIDKSYNVDTYSWYVTLDNTPPTVEFILQNENTDSTVYQTWTNRRKKIVFKAKDDSGIKKSKLYLNSVLDKNNTLSSSPTEYTFSYSVSSSEQGKLTYKINVYDNAASINKSTNTVNTSSDGNCTTITKSVWIDTTLPNIDIDINESLYYSAPLKVPVSVSDALSGIMKKEYAVGKIGDTEPTAWTSFTGSNITLNEGGMLYVRVTDKAGNTATKSKIVNINSPAKIITVTEPAKSSEYTIYNQTQYNDYPVYVVSSTSYSTKWNFDVYDDDINDDISVDIKLINCDNNNVFIELNSQAESNSKTVRTAEFTTKYVDSGNTALPDGVYDMYVTIKEIKNGVVIDNSEYTNKKLCEVVIKRSNPPTPIISVETDGIIIDYLEESTASSLNRDYIKALNKKQYKYVKNGANANEYKTYTNKKLSLEQGEVTAIYTDCAGNISTAVKRIDIGGVITKPTSVPIASTGDTALWEENRVANVYYIGIRRPKDSDLKNDIFGFLH